METTQVPPIATRVRSNLSDTDIKGLADILVRAVAEGASVGFLPPLTMAEATRCWRETVTTEGVITLVAERAGRIVGTVQVHLSQRANGQHRAEIARLLVHPDARRQGIAKMLMHAAEECAHRRGRSLLVLDTREGDPANALYRSLGYTEAGRIPGYARSASGDLAGTVIYWKELES